MSASRYRVAVRNRTTRGIRRTSIQAFFDELCEHSPLSTVEQELHTACGGDYRDLELFYDHDVAAEYLAERVAEHTPSFSLHPFETITQTLEDLAWLQTMIERDATPLALARACLVVWTSRLAYSIRPTLRYAIRELKPDITRGAKFLFGEPGAFNVSPNDPFGGVPQLQAAVASKQVIPTYSCQIPLMPDLAVYSQVSAKCLAREILQTRHEVKGSGGAVMILFAHDERSAKHVVAAEKIVRSEQTGALRQRLDEQLLGKAGQKQYRKIASLLEAQNNGLSRSATARLWMSNGMIKQSTEDPDDAFESAYKLVKRFEQKLAAITRSIPG